MLADTPLIAGSANQYALIQRISLIAQPTVSIAANSTAAAFAIGGLVLPLGPGQGIQIRDASFAMGDNDGTHHLTVNSAALFLQQGVTPFSTLCIRGAGSIPGGLLGVNVSEGWGTLDWPFIAWNDFPSLGSTLSPNLLLWLIGVAANNDAAPHVMTASMSVIFELWQAFAPRVGHVGL